MHTLNPQHLCMLAWSFARLGVHPPRSWCGGLLQETYFNLHKFQTQDLSNMAWALAKLRVQLPPRFLAAFYDQARDITNLVLLLFKCLPLLWGQACGHKLMLLIQIVLKYTQKHAERDPQKSRGA